MQNVAGADNLAFPDPVTQTLDLYRLFVFAHVVDPADSKQKFANRWTSSTPKAYSTLTVELLLYFAVPRLFHVPFYWFTHVHMDIVGSQPAVDNSPHRYQVPRIDRQTNWVEAEPQPRQLARHSSTLSYQDLVSLSVHNNGPRHAIRKRALSTPISISRTMPVTNYSLPASSQRKSWAFSSEIESQSPMLQEKLDRSSAHSIFWTL